MHMKNLKVEFPNKAGDALSARLSLPADEKPEYFALFAHYFTCNQNFNALQEILQQP